MSNRSYGGSLGSDVRAVVVRVGAAGVNPVDASNRYDPSWG